MDSPDSPKIRKIVTRYCVCEYTDRTVISGLLKIKSFDEIRLYLSSIQVSEDDYYSILFFLSTCNENDRNEMINFLLSNDLLHIEHLESSIFLPVIFYASEERRGYMSFPIPIPVSIISIEIVLTFLRKMEINDSVKILHNLLLNLGHNERNEKHREYTLYLIKVIIQSCPSSLKSILSKSCFRCARRKVPTCTSDEDETPVKSCKECFNNVSLIHSVIRSSQYHRRSNTYDNIIEIFLNYNECITAFNKCNALNNVSFEQSISNCRHSISKKISEELLFRIRIPYVTVAEGIQYPLHDITELSDIFDYICDENIAREICTYIQP